MPRFAAIALTAHFLFAEHSLFFIFYKFSSATAADSLLAFLASRGLLPLARSNENHCDAVGAVPAALALTHDLYPPSPS